MSLIYITSAPGIGKSTLQKELTMRGLETHDMDDPNLGGAHNKASGKRVEIPSADYRSPDWFNQHEWRIYTPAIKDLKTAAGSKDIFICGVAPTDITILPLFDKIIYLQLTDDQLRQRLLTRVGNDFGKNDFEIVQILTRKNEMDSRYTSLGVILINASGTVSQVADAIILQI